MNNADKIEKAFEEQGYITATNIRTAGIASWFLTDFVRKNGLMKVAKGFYASSNWPVDPFLVFQYKYKKFVFSHSSAAYLHHLADNLPWILEVSGPKNYRPVSPKEAEFVLHTVTAKGIYELGIAEMATPFGNKVLAYDLERTVCDLIKEGDKADKELYVKTLKAYLHHPKKKLSRLMEYAKKMRIGSKVRIIMEVLLNED